MKNLISSILLTLVCLHAEAQDAMPRQLVNEQTIVLDETDEVEDHVSENSFRNVFSDCIEVVEAKTYDKYQLFAVPIINDTSAKMGIFKSWDIATILNLEVFRYFKLDQYNSDLKRKLFKESTEYKGYLQQLTDLKKEILGYKFYCLIKFTDNYDIKEKGFPLAYETYKSYIPDLPNYLIRYDLCFDYATNRFPKHKLEIWNNYDKENYITQRIYLNVPDEHKALKIEDTPEKALLIIFKIDSAFTSGSGWWKRSFLKTKIQSLYIVDTETEEVLYKVL